MFGNLLSFLFFPFTLILEVEAMCFTVSVASTSGALGASDELKVTWGAWGAASSPGPFAHVGCLSKK